MAAEGTQELHDGRRGAVEGALLDMMRPLYLPANNSRTDGGGAPSAHRPGNGQAFEGVPSSPLAFLYPVGWYVDLMAGTEAAF